jgi:anaerobic selenocysteine-containing dehydrogenase
MTTRRELFQFVGGSAMGLLLTPAPWRLITDAALWSENWPGIPRPARGEIRTRFTHCGLCAAGCAVRARCVGEQPVSLAGVDGGLCPFGVTGHHLPYHPERLKQGNPRDASAAMVRAMASATPARRIAVLDLQPGRTASWTYRRALAAIPHGVYLAPEEPACAVNLEGARAVLSLGAPLLDGWAQASRMLAARPNFRLIQAEAVESRTAALADEWLAVQAGTEEALGRAAAGEITPQKAAEITGLAAGQIEQVVRALQEQGPALIVAPEMNADVLAWNLRLGAWGKTVLPRREAPVPKAWHKAAPVTRLAAVENGSLAALLIDESVPGAHLPWAAIQPKLARDAVVVVFAWSRAGCARHATRVLPTPAYPEAAGDLPPAIDEPVAQFRLTVPLVVPPGSVTDPAAFVSALAGLDAKDALAERAAAIHAAGRGSLRTYADGQSTPLKNLKAEDFWKALNAGGCWTGAQEDCGKAPRPAETAAPAPDADALWPFRLVTEGSPAATLVAPLMAKLSQESRLRLGPGRAAMHPRAGFEEGARVALETAYGRLPVTVTLDESVAPGAVLLADSPEIADIRGADGRIRVVRL